MAPRSRGRRRTNNHAPGNTRTDAALDAMRPYGFDEKLVRETVKELLDVYEGTQGWPFIEEASYKLLIETILSKQQISSEEKDNNATREKETFTSVAPSTCANSEAGSSNMVGQDSVLVAPQTNDALVSASLDGVDSTQFRVEAENERISVDNAIGSTNRTVDAKKVRLPVIRSSQPCDNVPTEIIIPCYGWIEDDTDEGASTQFRVEAEYKRISVDKSIGSNMRNVEGKQVRPSVIQSSQPHDTVPIKRHKLSYGQIESGINDEGSTQFRVETENKRISVEQSIGSNIKNMDAKQARPPVIQSSQPSDNVPIKRHKPSYGRTESDINYEGSTQCRVEAENKRMSVDKSNGSNLRNADAKQVRPPVIQSSQPRDIVPIKRHKPSIGRKSDINDEVSTQFRVEAENKRMCVDNAIGSNIRTVDAKQARPLVIQHSQPHDNVPIKRRKHGWIGSETSDEDLIRLPVPPLSEELIKFLLQNGAPKSGRRRRRKSRWDEKPDDVIS